MAKQSTKNTKSFERGKESEPGLVMLIQENNKNPEHPHERHDTAGKTVCVWMPLIQSLTKGEKSLQKVDNKFFIAIMHHALATFVLMKINQKLMLQIIVFMKLSSKFIK